MERKNQTLGTSKNQEMEQAMNHKKNQTLGNNKENRQEPSSRTKILIQVDSQVYPLIPLKVTLRQKAGCYQQKNKITSLRTRIETK
jgi:hypothetical protein